MSWHPPSRPASPSRLPHGESSVPPGPKDGLASSGSHYSWRGGRTPGKSPLAFTFLSCKWEGPSAHLQGCHGYRS